MKLNENDIQSLKAQEAKDLAVKLFKQLKAKEKGPLSPGEVQLKELEYELKLKEAEINDNRRREEHEKLIRELELQIEQEKTRQAEAASQADRVREEHAQVVEKVEAAMESLSIQLEKASREHNLKVERLESEYASRKEDLQHELSDMEARRGHLLEEIQELTDLTQTASEVGELRETIEARRNAGEQELHQLGEQAAEMEFEKQKKIKETKRSQELAIAELETQHKKDILQLNRKAADDILAGLGMLAVSESDWAQKQKEYKDEETAVDLQRAEIRERAREELRKEYNITMSDVIDVTALYYQEQAERRNAEALSVQVDKLENEIRRMREHIEKEPQRIATAVEAAKAQIQNYIEQSPKR
jgi:hypothetical protein